MSVVLPKAHSDRAAQRSRHVRLEPAIAQAAAVDNPPTTPHADSDAETPVHPVCVRILGIVLEHPAQADANLGCEPTSDPLAIAATVAKGAADGVRTPVRVVRPQRAIRHAEEFRGGCVDVPTTGAASAPTKPQSKDLEVRADPGLGATVRRPSFPQAVRALSVGERRRQGENESQGEPRCHEAGSRGVPGPLDPHPGDITWTRVIGGRFLTNLKPTTAWRIRTGTPTASPPGGSASTASSRP